MILTNKHLTPVWIVYVDGKRLDTDHEGALKKIVVDDKLNDVGMATLLFDTSYTKVRQTGTFSLESEVSIHLGYKDDCEQVFVGDVTEFIPEFNEYGHEQLKVVCKNCLYKLQNAHRALSFDSKLLSDVLKERLDVYKIKSDIDSFGTTKNYFVESQITDFDFIMESASKYGKTVYAYDSKVYIKDEVTISNDEVILEWGKSLIYFRGKESLKNQLTSCTFVGWDIKKCEAITGTSTLSDISLKVGGSKTWEKNSKSADGVWESTIIENDLFDNEDAQNRAKGYLQNLSMTYQTGECKCEGNYRIHPGMRVSVKYVGDYYSGEYIANHVIHEFSVYGGFTTTVYVKRNMTEGKETSVSAIDEERAEAKFVKEESTSGNAEYKTSEKQNNESEKQEVEKNPSIFNLHWEDENGKTITKALVGDEVYLCADVKDIDDGKNAKIKIVEKDDDGNDDEVTTLTAKVQNGKIEYKWKVIYTEDDDDSNSQQEKEEKGYTLPEYAFIVECAGVESDESGQLDVRSWVDFTFTKNEVKFLKNFKFYLYSDSDNWKSDEITIMDEKISFKDIPIFYKQNDCKLGVKL
ncbi:MAG: hypothetical protein IJ361_09635 [Spirochaetaceae bacterium]|nr:hypothetical protein [Spirochaetaceae bacterium]